MDFNEFGPSNTSPDTNSPLPPTDATGFEQQLNGAQGGAAPNRTASPALPGEPYSPYLDAGRHYSPYLDARHPYSPYLDIAHPYSPGLRWEDDSHAPAALGADPAQNRPRITSRSRRSRRILISTKICYGRIWIKIPRTPAILRRPLSRPAFARRTISGWAFRSCTARTFRVPYAGRTSRQSANCNDCDRLFEVCRTEATQHKIRLHFRTSAPWAGVPPL